MMQIMWYMHSQWAAALVAKFDIECFVFIAFIVLIQTSMLSSYLYTVPIITDGDALLTYKSSYIDLASALHCACSRSNTVQAWLTNSSFRRRCEICDRETCLSMRVYVSTLLRTTNLMIERCVVVVVVHLAVWIPCSASLRSVCWSCWRGVHA